MAVRLALLAGIATLGALWPAPPASAAPGELDPSFGSGGVVKLLESEVEGLLRAVAVQPDDKIVLAGGEPPGNVVLLRLLPNGQLDPSFGVGGKVVTAIPGGQGEARAVALQPDGKIVVAGGAQVGATVDFLIARYTSDGSLDPSFGGGDGIAIVPVGTEFDEAEALAIGSDGKIAAVGRVEAEGGKKELAGVVVLLPGGTPDAEFSGDGILTIGNASGYDRGGAVVALPDGRVLVGDFGGTGGGDGVRLYQFLPTGAPDPGFGSGGSVLTPIPIEGGSGGSGNVTDLARLGDGRIVASAYGYDEVGMPPVPDSKFAAVRYLANGELDESFGEGGIFSRQLGGTEEEATAIAAAEGGRVLLAGDYQEPLSKQTEPAVLRLGPDGGLDPTFGSGGLVLRGQTAPFGELVDDAAVDSYDRLVTVGTSYVGNNRTWVVVTRYLGDRLPPEAPAANQPPHARMKKVPRKVAAPRLKGFSGTASDPDGDGVRTVQIALAKLVPGGARASRRAAPACFALSNRRARFTRVRVKKGGRCPQRWLGVKGTAKWSFRLRSSLPPGRYVVYARAVDGRGLAEAGFSRRAGNRYAFRVVRSR